MEDTHASTGNDFFAAKLAQMEDRRKAPPSLPTKSWAGLPGPESASSGGGVGILVVGVVALGALYLITRK